MTDRISPTSRPPVLVLDGDQPSALAVVRALGRQGVPVQVAASVERPLAGSSRHAEAVLRYPDPLTQGEAFVAWIAAQLAAHEALRIIPITERTVVPLLRQRERFDDRRVALAPSDALEQVLDKSRTVALAGRLGIEVPRSVTVRSLDGLAEAAAPLGLPVVVKPARSVGSGAQGQVQLTVSYARDAKGLEAQVRHALQFGEVILQEYFQGEGVGIELIADHGQVRHWFQHRRLHEVPLTGGGSSLRCSEPVAPVLREAADRLITALAWHGVAMVEFKYQPETGAYRLMEINGRFWGSLPLAVAAGADFPAMLYELMTTGEVQPRPPARDGVVCRQLERDLNWLEHVLRRAAPPGLVRLPSGGQVLRDSLLVLSPRHHFDVQSWRDPWPGLVDLGRILRKQWQRVTDARAQRNALAKAQRDARAALARHPVQPGKQVLFVCYGNINRSALAQAYAEQRHAGSARFESAGFHPEGGRPADRTMVAVSAARQVRLDGWKSQPLDATMLRQADLILVMEAAHLDRLAAEHPEARAKAFLLGAAVAEAPGAAEVPDPYGRATAVYEQVADQVMRAVDAWVGQPRRAA